MNRARFILFFAPLMFVNTKMFAEHRDLHIVCLGEYGSSCCTAISESGGGSPITYVWSTNKGHMDPVITPTNFSEHHCPSGNFGTYDIYNDVDSGVLIGHGTEVCSF